jgi:hypothetical protein
LSGIERFQECNVREDYRQTAFGGHQQKMNCGLPLGVVLGLGQGLNVTPSVEKRSQPPAVRWFESAPRTGVTRTSTDAHRGGRLLSVPVEIRSDVGTSLAAALQTKCGSISR